MVFGRDGQNYSVETDKEVFSILDGQNLFFAGAVLLR